MVIATLFNDTSSFFSGQIKSYILVVLPKVFKINEDERYSTFSGADIRYLYESNPFSNMEIEEKSFANIGFFLYDYDFAKLLKKIKQVASFEGNIEELARKKYKSGGIDIPLDLPFSGF
jgi:hypothetical protein